MLVSSAGILHVLEEFSATQSGAAVEVILNPFLSPDLRVCFNEIQSVHALQLLFSHISHSSRE